MQAVRDARERSAPARPADKLIGRESELALLAAVFAEGARLVSVVGAPGAGKTRLARDFAAGERGRGPVWFCDLTEARSTRDLVAALGATLEVRTDGDRAAGIAAALERRRPALVVLDNAEKLAPEAASEIASWVAEAPSARLLVTSRARLGVEDRCVELGPLAPGPAIELFVARARRVRADFDPGRILSDVLARLVDRLDRLPLAIELAAARISVLSPGQLLERIGRGLDVLRDGGRGRHASLAEAIRCSWELLAPHERSALAQCAVFHGGFSLEAAEAVVDLSAHPGAPPVIDLVQALRDASLVQRSASGVDRPLRLSLLDSIRAFARAQLTDAEARAATARHAAYHVAEGERLAEACDGPGGADAALLLALERDNLLAAHRASLEEAPALAARAVLALYPLMSLQGPGVADAPLLEAAVRAARRAEDPALLGTARLTEALAAQRHGQAGLAGEAIAEALALARAAGDERLEARALIASARRRIAQGDLDGAEAECERAAAVLGRLGDAYHEGLARVGLGRIEESRGHLSRSVAHFEAALQLFRRQGSLRLQAVCLRSLGVLRSFEGRHEDARALLEEALALSRRARDRASEADCLVALGNEHLTAGRLDDAEHHLRTALAAEREMGNRRFEGMAICNLAIVAHERGDLPGARSLYQQAVAIWQECGERRLIALLLPFFAAAEASLGLLVEARRDLDAARTIYEELGDPGNFPALMVCEGFLDLAAGDVDAARRRLEAGERARAAGQAPRDSELPVALRLLARALGRGAGLEVGPEGRWFRIGGGQPVDVSRRAALRRILDRLVAERRSAPGHGLSPDELFEAGWPGERAAPESAAGRVYTAVRTLRRLGLERVLLRQDDGYLLDPQVELVQRTA